MECVGECHHSPMDCMTYELLLLLRAQKPYTIIIIFGLVRVVTYEKVIKKMVHNAFSPYPLKKIYVNIA